MFSFLYSIFLGYFEIFPLSAQGADTLLGALLGKPLPPISSAWLFGAAAGCAIAFWHPFWDGLKGVFFAAHGIFKGTFKWRKAKAEQIGGIYGALFALIVPMMLLILQNATIGSGLGFIGLMFLASGALLFIGDHTVSQERSLLEMKGSHGFKLALFEAVALLPGLSRSGVTLGMALNMGFSRKSAFDLMVFFSIPALLVLGFWNLSSFAAFGAVHALLCFAGGAAGALLGGLSLKWLFQKDLLNIAVALSGILGAGAIIFSFVR